MPRSNACCRTSAAYFACHYVEIYDATTQGWLKFDLWPAQADTLSAMAQSKKLVVLKARQLGISWLSLSYALWLMLFHPPATTQFQSLLAPTYTTPLNANWGQSGDYPVGYFNSH